MLMQPNPTQLADATRLPMTQFGGVSREMGIIEIENRESSEDPIKVVALI